MSKQSYKERVKKVDTYITKNKLYIGIIIIIIILVLSNTFGFKEKSPQYVDNTESSTVDSENEISDETPHWRFYWSDLIILIAGTGFCSFKIIQQHKKEREKL